MHKTPAAQTLRHPIGSAALSMSSLIAAALLTTAWLPHSAQAAPKDPTPRATTAPMQTPQSAPRRHGDHMGQEANDRGPLKGPMSGGMPMSPLGVPMHHLAAELKLSAAQDAALQRAELASAKRHIAARHEHERARQATDAALADPNTKLADVVRLREPKPDVLEPARREELDAWTQFVDSLDSQQSTTLRKAMSAAHDRGHPDAAMGHARGPGAERNQPGPQRPGPHAQVDGMPPTPQR